MAEYLKKKLSKELHHSKNPPELQRMVDAGKDAEWQTLMAKPNALKIHYGKAAGHIRRTRADRFIGSRFVLTRKPVEEGRAVDVNDLSTFIVKGLWCTLSQLGRMTLMQVIHQGSVSRSWASG